MVGAAIVQAVAVFALSNVLGLSAERVVLGWRRRIMEHVTRLPASALDDAQSGALASRVMDDATHHAKPGRLGAGPAGRATS